MQAKKHFLHRLCFGLLMLSSASAVLAQNIVVSGTPTSFCAPVVVTFSTANMPGGSSNYTYTWTFSSPSGTFSGSPTLTYANAGVYTANCTATNTTSGQVITLPSSNFTIHPAINAGFTITSPLGNPPQVCAGDNITINNTTTGGTPPLTFNWAYSGGVNTNNPANPSIINFPVTLSAGIKNIQLVVTDALGCQAFVPAQTIQLNASPNANFTINQPNPCLGLVNFSTASGTAGLDHTWVFDPQTTFNTTNVNTSHTYNVVSGQFPVTLTITDQATGCSSTFTDTVQIGQNPPVITTSVTGGVCQGGSVLFTSPPPPGNTLSWAFPGASPNNGAGASVQVTYNTPGTYWAYAVLTNTTSGCIGEDSVQIVVSDPPTAGFTVNQNAVCDVAQATNFDFTSTSTTSAGAPPIVAYNWTLSGSAQGNSALQDPQNITYSNTGAFNVTLTVTDAAGCTNTFTATNYILVGGAEAGFTAAPPGGCVNQAIQLNATPTMNNATSIVSYAWTSAPAGSFSNSTAANTTVSYNSQGNKTITLTITDDLGCTSSSNLIVEVGTPVNGLTFTANPAFDCVATPFTFINTTNNMPSGALTYWDFGETPPATTNPGLSLSISHDFDDIDCFDVTMYVNNNGCITQTTQNNVVCTTGTLAKFEADTTNGCNVPFSVQLNDASTPGATLSWAVNPFVNANLSSTTGTNPVLTLNAPGTYTVTLYATGTNSTCPTDDFSMIFTVGKPSAAFTLSPSEDTLCVGGATINPVITSANSSANYTYSWGDGSVSNYSAVNVTSANHTYSAAGMYNVTLIATNTIGCSDTVTLPTPIYVGGLTPSISVNSPNSGCAPHTINVIGNAAAASGINVVAWDWSSTTSLTPSNPTGQNATFSMDANGTFDLILFVTDNVGCSGFTILSNAIVVGKPVAAFNPQYAAYCGGVPVTYVNASTGTSLNYNWQFPGGTPSSVVGNIPNPTGISYSNSPFPYTATLIVTDMLGCSDTATASVGVSELVASFTSTNTVATCPPLTVFFTATTNAPHNIISYDWNFGQFVTTDTTHWTYAIPGDYDVQLIVTSDAGCRDTVFQPNLVQIDGPMASYNFSPKTGCPGTEVTLQLLNATDAHRYWWIYGDGGVSDTVLLSSGIMNNLHTYIQPGLYTPVIVVENIAGCDVVMKPIDTLEIYHPPQVDFSATPAIICQSGTSTLASLSVPGDAPLVSYEWNMPLGTPSSGVNASTSVSYTNIGSYDIQLIVTDANGCKDSLTKDDFIFVVDNIQPTAPPIESASTMNNTEVNVIYRKFPNPNNDFAEYRLYRDGTQVYSSTNINDTTYLDTGLDTRNINYTYEVEVVSACGTPSPKSPLHTTMVLSSVSQNGGIQLNWTPYIGWGSVQNYRLYRVSDYSNLQNLVATLDGNTLSYLDTMIDCAAAISYRIEAVSANNISTWSDTTQGAGVVSGTLPTPLNMRLATVVNNQFVRVAWDNIPYIRRLKEIVIERDAGTGFQGIQAYPVGNFPNPLEYEDNAQINVNQQAYTYRVVGIDSCDQRTIAGRVATSIYLNAQNVGGSILLTWTPYSEWAEGVDYYQVELLNQNTQQYITLGTVLPPLTAYIDDTVMFAQGQNCYRILAYEKQGNQLVSMSNEDCASPDATIFSPTAFTPNGDGINDVFMMTSTFVKDFYIVIFDRWGKKIFESTDITQGWDGKINGKDAPEGVYTYRVEMLGHAEGSIKRSRYGTITLVR